MILPKLIQDLYFLQQLFRLLTYRPPLILYVERSCPAIDVLDIKVLALNLYDPGGVSKLPFGFTKFRPFEFREQHVFGRCRVHGNTKNVDLLSATNLSLAEWPLLAHDEVDFPDSAP